MLTFIVNPNAGGEKGYRIWKRMERRLIRKHIEYQVLLTGGRGEAQAIAAELTADLDRNTGAENGEMPEPLTLVAVGGDGIMNEVIDGIHLSERLTLGFIPIGGRSDLAMGLGLPRRPEACLRRILEPKEIRQMDYGVVDYNRAEPTHRRFAVSCGCGFDAAVMQTFRRHALRHFTGIPFLYKLRKFLLSCQCLTQCRTTKGYLVMDADRRIELNHIFLVSALVQPTEAGGMHLAPGAQNTDGELTVTIFHNRSKLQLFRVLMTSVFRNPMSYAGVRSYSCRELSVYLEEALPMQTDGEFCGLHAEYNIRCVRQKLRIIC